MLKDENLEPKYMEMCVSSHKILSSYQFGKLLNRQGENLISQPNALNLRTAIWKHWLEKSVEVLNSDEIYKSYNVYEKLAAFYFTLFMQMSEQQAYVRLLFKHTGLLQIVPECLSDHKNHFMNIYKQIINEGIDSGMMESRKVIDGYNHYLIWMQTVYLIRFWSADKSENNLNTDAAIEKTTNLIADILGRNLIDSGFDMVKFLMQKKTDERTR